MAPTPAGGEKPRGSLYPEPIPHDQLIKTLLETFFPELLDLVVPELADKIDPDGLETLDKETFTDLPRGRRREVDLLVRAPLHDGEES